ncbi:hypothetical protein BC829DRAFT_60482 [Chytridium lagenaria]|nr:hypothetical protein BC829DRAFT_60482 [Chytridium lagenaria]
MISPEQHPRTQQHHRRQSPSPRQPHALPPAPFHHSNTSLPRTVEMSKSSFASYLTIILSPSPDELAAVRDVFPVPQVVSDANVSKDEAVVRTKAALLTLKAAWASGSPEWKELDECLEIHGFPSDPSRSITDPAAALDVLHGYFRRIALQAITSHDGLGALSSCIQSVTTFSMAQAHLEMQERYMEEYHVLKHQLGDRAVRRRDAEIARIALLEDTDGGQLHHHRLKDSFLSNEDYVFSSAWGRKAARRSSATSPTTVSTLASSARTGTVDSSLAEQRSGRVLSRLGAQEKGGRESVPAPPQQFVRPISAQYPTFRQRAWLHYRKRGSRTSLL